MENTVFMDIPVPSEQQNLMKNTKRSLEQAMNALGTPEAEWENTGFP